VGLTLNDALTIASRGNATLARELQFLGINRGDRTISLTRVKRLFVIKTRFEATRGAHYTVQYPGVGGYLLFAATAGAVFLGGAKILDALRYEREAREAGADTAEKAGLQP
jgi:hypothetical protein